MQNAIGPHLLLKQTRRDCFISCEQAAQRRQTPLSSPRKEEERKRTPEIEVKINPHFKRKS
jgi:hypothetical protein